MIILVTGGTGTLGQVLVPKLFGSLGASRVRVLSRDEHKQIWMDEKLKDSRIDYFVGDVRDEERLQLASRGCEMVFHLAAVKSVDKVEYNPFEAVKTNIQGTQNVIKAALFNDIPRSIFTSTDKAVEPLNVYGSTKLAAERIFVTANSYSGDHGPRFSAVRYGNVFGSNGSVIQKWRHCAKTGQKIKITDPNMTRFWILVEEAADFIIESAKRMDRGEVFIPKMKSCSMAFLLAQVFPEIEPEIIGKRPGEKLHEKLFSKDEVSLMHESDFSFLRYPENPNFKMNIYENNVTEELTSYTAQRFTSEEMQRMIACI